MVTFLAMHCLRFVSLASGTFLLIGRGRGRGGEANGAASTSSSSNTTTTNTTGHRHRHQHQHSGGGNRGGRTPQVARTSRLCSPSSGAKCRISNGASANCAAPRSLTCENLP